MVVPGGDGRCRVIAAIAASIDAARSRTAIA